MILADNIQKLLKKRSGFDINAPKAFYSLALDIKSKTGEAIGENTLRRLFGVLNDERMPHKHTLDILARYLSAPDWESLNASSGKVYSHMDANLEISHAADLPAGEGLELTWYPDRRIRIRKEEDGYFTVTLNENSKLNVGDRLRISSIARTFPFIASDVIRDGAHLGSYIGAEENGVASIRKI